MSQSGKFTPSNPLDNGRVPVTPNDGRTDPPEITTDCCAYPGTSGPLHAGDGSVAFRGLFDRDAASEQQAMPQPPKNNPFESRIIANFMPFIYDMHKYEEYEYEQMDGYIRVINKMFGADAENPKSFFPYWKDIGDASVAQEGAFVGSCAVVVEGAAPGPVQSVHIVELHAHKFELVPGMPAPIDQFQYVHVLGGTESAYQDNFVAPAYTDADTAYASMMDMSWLTLSDPMYTGLVGNIVLINAMQGYGITWSYRPGAAHAMDTHVETYLGMPHDYEGEPIYGNLTIIESVFTPPSWEEAVIWQDGRPYYVKYPFVQLYKSSHDFVGETTWEHWGAFASMVDVLATNNWDYTFEYGVFDGWITDARSAVKTGAYIFVADLSQDAKGFELESVLTTVFTADGVAWHDAWSRYADMPDTLTCTWEDIVLVPQANCDYGKLSNLVEYAPIMEGPSRKGDQAFRTDFSFFAGHTEAVTCTWDDQMRVIPQLNVDYYHCQIIDSPLLGESRNQLGPYFATFAFDADMNAVNVSYGDIDVSPVIPWPHDQAGMLESLSFAIVPYIQDNADLYADMCNAMYTADMPDMGWTIETNQFSAEEVLLLMPDNRKLGYDQVLPYTADKVPGLEWARSEDQVHGDRIDARMFVDDNTRLTLTYDGTFMIVYHDAYQPTLLDTTWDETKYVIPHDPNVQLGYARQLQEISMAPILDPFGNRNDWLVLPPLDGMEITWEQDNILTPQLNFDWKKTQDLESFKFAIELDKFSGFSFFLADETPGLEVTWEQNRILNPDNDFVNGHVVVLSEPGPVIQAMWSHFDSIVVGAAFTQDVLEWGMEEHAMSLGINKWFLFSGYEVWSYTAYLDNNLPFSYLKAFMKPALDPQEALSSHTAPMHMPSVGCHTEAHAVQGAGEFTFFPETTTTTFDFLFVDGVIPVFDDGLHIPAILHEPHAVYIWFASSLGRGYSTMSFGTQSVMTTVVCADADTVLSGMAPNSPHLAWSDADITEYGMWGGSSVMPFDADMPTGILCDVGFFNRKPNDEFVNTAWVAEALVPPILLFDVLIFPADETEAVLHDKGWLESTENIPSRNFVSVMTSLNGEFDFDNWPSFDADKAFTADAGVDNMYAPRVMDEKKAHGWWDAAKFTMDYSISFDWNVGDVWYAADRTGLHWNMSSQHTVAHGWWDAAKFTLDFALLRDAFGVETYYAVDYASLGKVMENCFHYAHGWWDTAELSLDPMCILGADMVVSEYASGSVLDVPPWLNTEIHTVYYEEQLDVTLDLRKYFGIDGAGGDAWYAPDPKPVDWDMALADNSHVAHGWWDTAYLVTLTMRYVPGAESGVWYADSFPELNWYAPLANNYLAAEGVAVKVPEFTLEPAINRIGIIAPESFSYLYRDKNNDLVYFSHTSGGMVWVFKEYRLGPDIVLYQDSRYALLKQPYSIYKGVYGWWYVEYTNLAHAADTQLFSVYDCRDHSVVPRETDMLSNGTIDIVQHGPNLGIFPPTGSTKFRSGTPHFYNSQNFYLDNQIYGGPLDPDTLLAMGQEATVMLSPWNNDFSIIPIYATHAPEAHAKDGENNVAPDPRADMFTGYALVTQEHPFYSIQFNMLFDWNVSDTWYAKNGEHDITPDSHAGITETYALTDTAFPLYTTDFNTIFDWNISDAWFAGHNTVFTAPDLRSSMHTAFFDELKLAAYAPYTHCGEHSQPDLFGSVENQVSVGIWDSVYSWLNWTSESTQNAAHTVCGVSFEFTLAPALTFDWNVSDTWYTQLRPVLELADMTGFATGAFAEAGNKLAMLDWFPDIMTLDATAAPVVHTADWIFDPGWADYPWVSAWASAEIEVMFNEATGGHMPGTGADAWQTFDGDALTYPMWPLFQFAAHAADTILFSPEIGFTNGVLEGCLGDGDEVIINDAMCVHPAMEGFIELTGLIFGDFWLSTMQPISAEMSIVLSVTEEMVAAVYPDQRLAFYVSQEFPNILEVESTATLQPGVFIEISTFEEQQILPNWNVHLAMPVADHPYGYIDTLNKEIASQLAFVSYEMEPSVISNIPAATDWEKYLKAYGSCAATATQYAGTLVCKYIGCPYWAVIVDGVIVVQDPPFVYIPMIPEIELWFDYQTDSQLDMAFVF